MAKQVINPQQVILKLGYAEVTSTQGSITSTEVDLTGLTVTVTAPGGKDLRVTGFTWPSSTANGETVRTFVKEGTTYLGFFTGSVPTTPVGFNQFFSVRVPAPTAGSHTYKLSMQRINGSGTISSNAGSASSSSAPAFIMVETM